MCDPNPRPPSLPRTLTKRPCRWDAPGLASLPHLDVHHVALGLIFGLEFLRLHDDQLPRGDFQELGYFSVESVVEFVILSQVVS